MRLLLAAADHAASGVFCTRLGDSTADDVTGADDRDERPKSLEAQLGHYTIRGSCVGFASRGSRRSRAMVGLIVAILIAAAISDSLNDVRASVTPNLADAAVAAASSPQAVRRKPQVP